MVLVSRVKVGGPHIEEFSSSSWLIGRTEMSYRSDLRVDVAQMSLLILEQLGTDFGVLSLGREAI